MSGSEEATFRFTLLPSSTLASIKDKSKEAVELFEKWLAKESLYNYIDNLHAGDWSRT